MEVLFRMATRFLVKDGLAPKYRFLHLPKRIFRSSLKDHRAVSCLSFILDSNKRTKFPLIYRKLSLELLFSKSGLRLALRFTFRIQ